MTRFEVASTGVTMARQIAIENSRRKCIGNNSSLWNVGSRQDTGCRGSPQQHWEIRILDSNDVESVGRIEAADTNGENPCSERAVVGRFRIDVRRRDHAIELEAE